MTISKKIHIYGIVQGVGFRPFVYRIAHEHGLRGYVLNFGNGVEIWVEGDDKKIDEFLHDLNTGIPPLSKIDKMVIEKAPEKGFEDFTIKKSKKSSSIKSSIIPPDVDICDNCLSEMFNPSDRRYHYPFTVCMDCGPRYTTISCLPYDRQNTTMVDFPLCKKCNEEYTAPVNRRHHAQSICCSDCGPRIMLYDDKRELVLEDHSNEAILKTAKLLDNGSILAIKGIGGVHIAAKATDDEPLLRLRKNLGRLEQPFAVMTRDVETARNFTLINPIEEGLLTSYRKPIVVLEKSEGYHLSQYVAPKLHNIAVFLPYAGLHHLLFRTLEEPTCVMTSANLPGRPMITSNAEAFEKLDGIVDYYLLHNRRITNRADDSVVRMIGDKTSFIRRSRGYVPEPITMPFTFETDTLGVGPEINNTVTVLRGDQAYVSQYIGDTKKIETLRYHNEVVDHLKQLTGINPLIWGCDLHPSFNTTHYAMENAEKTIKVQHHYAHLVSLMADAMLPREVRIIGIAADGAGYGTDGTIWGGEILEVSYDNFRRCASLETQPMPGGDAAAYYPSRMVLGILSKVLSDNELAKMKLRFKHYKEREIVIEQLRRNINVIPTTSTGRVLDAISSLLGIAHHRSYEGEPAMKLESIARKGKSVEIPLRFKTERLGSENRVVLDTTQIVLNIYENLEAHSRSDLAFSAEDAIATGLAELAVNAAEKRGIGTIGLSGGVAYNEHITIRAKEIVEAKDFTFIRQDKIPTGDGGVSLGQAIIASLVDDNKS
ncbi:MAG TPA: carbamoyltransferase HypF [Methanocellales archaeon]|nr:carbamoyltransferase HypF [Methanocellales archaeon]